MRVPQFSSRLPVAWRLPAAVLAGAVGIAAVTASAAAQTVTPPPPASGRVNGQVGGQATVNGQVGFSQKAQLTPPEQLAQGDVILARLQAGSTTVAKQLGEARAAHDVVKVLCLNDKLSQMDVALRSAQDRKQSLATAVQGNNVELANHEFTIMTVLKQRADQLSAEANQCIGEDMAFVGETQTTATIDPNVPIGDETAYPPTDPTLVSGPPLPTSADK